LDELPGKERFTEVPEEDKDKDESMEENGRQPDTIQQITPGDTSSEEESSISNAPQDNDEHKENAEPVGGTNKTRNNQEKLTPTRIQPKRMAQFQGNWKDHLNMEDAKSKQAYVCAYTTLAQDIKIPVTYKEAMESEYAEEWAKACAQEIASLSTNGTWELVNLLTGRKPVKSKWVFAIKRDEKGVVERFKARLVAKGFSQIEGINYFETYASVIKLTTI
jgi:hypothetical protein